MEKLKTVLIVAGEASGDLHAASLVRAIKAAEPGVRFFGLGGRRLEQEGVELLHDIVGMAVVGLFEVLKNLRAFHRIFRDLLKKVDATKPDLAILVDYPGFNLRLACALKERGIRVVYYISPQVWAWGAGRIRTIKENVERMMVVFQFEEELYRRHGVPVTFVGHPLLDTVQTRRSRDEVCAASHLDPRERIIALLPGSREKEVKTLLPVMLKAAERIRARLPGAQFVILRSATVKEEIFNAILGPRAAFVRILSEMTYEGLSVADFAIVASGTATLETAILQVPMVIVYKISLATWLYLKTAIRIPFIGLVNVVRQKKIVPECVQFDATPAKIADTTLELLLDDGRLGLMKEELAKIPGLLGAKGASGRGAAVILELLRQ